MSTVLLIAQYFFFFLAIQLRGSSSHMAIFYSASQQLNTAIVIYILEFAGIVYHLHGLNYAFNIPQASSVDIIFRDTLFMH